MIQFNLLPDVKIEYIKTKRLKRLVLLIAFAVTAVSVLMLFLTFSYVAVQKRHQADLDKDIKRLADALNNTPELTKILSVQDQLKALPDLYNARPALDRLPGYLERVTPVGVSINRLSIDLEASAMELTGTADKFETVNNFVDALKFATYKTDEEGVVSTPAFQGVVLSSFGRDDASASFALRFTFDPVIFDITKKVEISIANIITTHSDLPNGSLFDNAPINENGGDNGR